MEQHSENDVSIIPEQDVIVLRNPTDVWLLEPNEDGELKLYEQWERDRRFKAKAVYYHPNGTTFYLKNNDDPFGVRTADTDSPLDTDNVVALSDVNENIHVLQEGENIWDVARARNVPVANLIAENDLEDPIHVPAGTELYIPTRQSNKDEAEVTYDIYEKPIPMHIIRAEGAKKWSFGGIKKWEDLYSTGRLYPQGHNLWIVAVANVPVGDMTAGYYMDVVSFGDYLKTGRVRYTTGFNHTHLAEGHTKEGTPIVPASTVEQVVADAMLEEDRPALLPEPETPVIAPETAVETEEEVPVLQVTHAPTWKDSFEFLNDEKQPIEYMFNEAYDVTELEGKLPSKHVSRNDIVRIIGTFEKDGIEYARPAVKGYWYGVPTALLTLEETVYDTDIDLPTRIALRGHLSRSEKRLVAMAKAVGNYRKLTSFVRKK